MKSLLSGSAVVLMLMLAGPSVAAAQATVIRPDRELTPDETVLRSAMYQLRDTLGALAGSSSRMLRDFRRTSPEALVSRARQIENGCQAGIRNIPKAREEVRTHPMKNALETAQQKHLLKAYDDLEAVLTECSRTFSTMAQPGKGEEVRGYGNARLESLRAGLKRYNREADDFLSALRIPNRPLGAGPNPFNNG
jgi:hypothetical protein